MARTRSSWFMSKKWRPNKWPFYGLLGFELALTIALLALFGIAAPNTYRTRLWQDGADNGFNSSPTTGLYAAANYKPYKTPTIWSKTLTNYNLVIVILSMFFMLVKSIMYMVNVFPPIMSSILHAVLVALYAASVYYQASSDTTDPEHPQNGPAWYITKSCSVAHSENNIGYCKQAKASFGASVALLGIFLIYLGISVWSCLPSKAHREEVAVERKERDEKYDRLERMHEEAMASQAAEYGNATLPPETPGLQSGMNPMTPRTTAFNKLGGTKDLPLRSHFSSTRPTSPSYRLNSPGAPKSPLRMPDLEQGQRSPIPQKIESQGHTSPRPGDPMYFPPPPKKANKK